MVQLIRTIIAALLLAAPLAAEDVPRFLVERVDVRSLRHASPEIVIAESRIRAGTAYTEQELRVAADRVARLPFVLGTDFALEKGSVRDAYVLVINVAEAKPFFYLADLIPTIGDGAATAAYGSRVAVGLRFFAGRRGMFHAGFSGEDDKRPYTNDYDAWEVGYTHYDILGTRAFATLNLRRPLALSHERSRTLPQLLLGIPVSPNQTITVLYTALDVGSGTELRSRLAERVATVRLTYDTTNQPFFPTRGMLLTVAPVAVWSDRKGVRYQLNGVALEPFLQHTRSLALEGTAARYWELSDRNSVSATLDGGMANYQTRGSDAGSVSRHFGSMDAGISHRLSDPAAVAAGESRIELHLRAATRGQVSLNIPGSATQASIAWVKRNAWGNLRLGLGYAW